jgi:hypothetical protein
MTTSLAYVAISIVVLAVVAILVFLVHGKRAENRITPLAGMAFAIVLAGILFGEDRLVGYALMGIGIVLAVADIVNRSRSK